MAAVAHEAAALFCAHAIVPAARYARSPKCVSRAERGCVSEVADEVEGS